MSNETLMTTEAATTPEGQETSQSTEQQAQTPPAGGQEQQQAEAPKEQQGAPEQYEFAAGEGQEFDPQVIEQFAEVARELNLPQDAAQKVLDKMAPVIASRQVEQIQAAREQWATDAKADQEYGGDKLTENLSFAKKAMDDFATPELRTLLNESGLGNHPEVIRVFVRVGKATSEDSFVNGKSAPQNARDPKRLYPNSNMN